VGERRLTFHYGLRALILAGFSFFIAYLAKSDRLMYYIAPRMENYVKYAAIGLFVVAVGQVYLALRSHADKAAMCGCEHEPPRSIWRNGLMYLLFVFPLLLGVALPDTLMGSAVVEIKGMNLTAAGAVKPPKPGNGKSAVENPSDGIGVSQGGPLSVTENTATSPDPSRPEFPGNDPEPSGVRPGGETEAMPPGDQGEWTEEELNERFPSDPFTEEFARLGMKLYQKKVITITEEGFMELLTAIDLYMDNFVGKSMEISGFVYREPDMTKNQFVVSRLAMQCCSADAAPYGILVESDQASKLAQDTWVKITGTIGKSLYNDNEIMKLDAVRIETIPAPETPYVYPFFDDFDKLVDDE